MPTQYFKRFRMEFDLQRTPIPAARLPEGYDWTAWSGNALLRDTLVRRHAVAKHAAFRDDLDSQIFPCLGDTNGCLQLMYDIADRETFCPAATWLISRVLPDGTWVDDCATIQGITHAGAMGAIQNVGVTPAHRGLGLGRALVLRALAGFLHQRMNRVSLEVTARNIPAVSLYRSIGFVLVRTSYKAITTEVEAAEQH